MNLRRQTAHALADVLKERLELLTKPAVISAPPSGVGDVPAMAVWLERFKHEFHQEDELMVNSAGQLMMGALASLDPPAGPASVDGKHRLSRVGEIQCEGRIWAGCRLPALREKLEDKVTNLVTSDTAGIGTLSLTLKSPKIEGKVLPWTWNIVVDTGDTEWVDEYAFSERLWSWIRFEASIDILALRTDPLMTQIVIAFQSDDDPLNEVPTPETYPEEAYQVDENGNVDPYVPPP